MLFRSLAERLRHTQRIAPLLSTGLNGNPRQCKRFLNTLLMRRGMAQSRSVSLDEQVLAKLMLLEYFRPESFRRLAQLQSEQQGRPAELTKLEQRAKPAPAPEPKISGAVPDDGDQEGERARRGAGSKLGREPAPVEDELPGEFQLWLSDPWTRDWLALEPLLCATKQVDLRPYFFFSRDQLGRLGAEIQRLSPMAQETLNQLLHESEAVRGVALKNAPSLSPSDRKSGV